MIATHALCRSFGKTTAVADLDLEVRPGEVFGFLGPNGAGKTTTIRMLCGLLRPDSGSIHIGDVDLARQPAAARRLFGLVPDTPPLYDYLTVREYVGFVCSLYRIDAAARAARLPPLLERLGLRDCADELCRGLSHGTRKKVHLAAMLTVAPRLLILDEPTSGLDPRSARVFGEILRERAAGGTTVFLSTHILAAAEQVCDRVGILHRGRLLACGTLEQLRASRQISLEEVFLQLTEAADASPRGTDAPR